MISNDQHDTYICTALCTLAIGCGSLNQPNGGQVSTDGTSLGSQANYSCSEGYVLNGNTTRVCQNDGQWSGSEPICEGQGCEYRVYEWYVRKVYAIYLMVLFSIIIALQFTAILCANLSSPVSGTVILDANTFGSQANYSCSEGYTLNGTTTRVCQADGQWSGSEPICEGQSLA